MKKLKTGLIGIGDFILKQHLPNALRCEWLQVAALCDLQPESLQRGLGLAPEARGYGDYRELLANPDIELIVLALDPRLHAPIAIEAMRAGKHVYVEKPLAEDIETAFQVAAIARQTGRHVATGFNRRFAPACVDAFNLVRDDQGPIMLSHRMVDDKRDRAGKWLVRSRLFNECCHAFDLFNWFVGSQPVRVHASGIGREEDAQMIFEYANGATASLVTSSYGAFHWPKERLEIIGDNKVVVIEDFVELQSGGIPGWELRRYEGCEYDGFSRGYGKMFATLGLPFYRQMRSHMAEMLLQSGVIEEEPDEDKWTALARRFPEQIRMPVNYACDKGWFNALAEFGRALLEGKTPTNADAHAAALTIRMGMAADMAIRTGTPQAIAGITETGHAQHLI